MNIVNDLVKEQAQVWMLVIIGSVCVIGIVNFLKSFIKGKNTVKWIVLLVSLGVALILSPIVPAPITTVLILWFLILAVSTMARDAIVDGIPSLVSKMIGKGG